MAFNGNITPGAPPLLWSNVYDAFTKINENFDILVATIGDGSGLSPISFETLDTSVKPSTDNLYTIGDPNYRWREIHAGEYSEVDLLNGFWAGTAHIKGINGIIELPPGSKVGNNLIIDPDKTFFKEIQVNNNLSIVATQFSDSFNLLSGSGIGLNVNSSSDSIEIENTGILDVVTTPGSGIAVSIVNGISSISNIGVRSLQSTTALPSGRTTGSGIHIDKTNGDDIRITNTGVITITSGGGITVSTDSATGEVTLTNAAPAVNAFGQVQVNGDTANRLLADSVSDTLNINSGQGITLTKNPAQDSITITVDPRFDLKGSIFGDDSTKIVDAVENKVYATFFGNLTGNVTGNLTGNVTGNVSGSAGSAGVAGTVDILNTNNLTTTYYPTFVENRTTGQTIRADADLTYRTDTNTLTAPAFAGNLTGTVTGNIFTNLIDSADSSQIVVTPLMRFQSDVVVENEVFVRGSKIILLDNLKSLVAASTDFANFKARIAALV